MIKQKLKTACYMATAINEWIILQQRDEMQEEQISLKQEAEKAMTNVEASK